MEDLAWCWIWKREWESRSGCVLQGNEHVNAEGAIIQKNDKCLLYYANIDTLEGNESNIYFNSYFGE